MDYDYRCALCKEADGLVEVAEGHSDEATRNNALLRAKRLWAIAAGAPGHGPITMGPCQYHKPE